MAVCYCNSGIDYAQCCELYITGTLKAPTAEALMRSRYSAYAIHDADYLWQTTAPKERKHHSKAAMLEWAKANQWLKLEVLKTTETIVEFKAYYLDSALRAQVHYEKSQFTKVGDTWYYVDGEY